jgi:hypothetical protein
VTALDFPVSVEAETPFLNRNIFNFNNIKVVILPAVWEKFPVAT